MTNELRYILCLGENKSPRAYQTFTFKFKSDLTDTVHKLQILVSMKAFSVEPADHYP